MWYNEYIKNVNTKDSVMLNCYVIDRSKDTLIPATYEQAILTDLTNLRTQKWNFAWSSIYRKGIYLIYKITVGGSLQGLIALHNNQEMQAVEVANAEVAPHNLGSTGKYLVGPTLFALACKYSFDIGQEGYVQLTAKTRLIQYYQAKLGAVPVSSQIMIIYPQQSVKLVQKYVILHGG
jgi:hypothetical protein